MNNFSELCIFVKSFPGVLAWVERDLGGKDKSWLLMRSCQKDGREIQIGAQIDGNKTISVVFQAVLLHDGKTRRFLQVILTTSTFKGFTQQYLRRVPVFRKHLITTYLKAPSQTGAQNHRPLAEVSTQFLDTRLSTRLG